MSCVQGLTGSSAATMRMYASALASGNSLQLVRDGGRSQSLAVDRWTGEVDVDDMEVVDRCGGFVLDVGCGPARFVCALMERGLDVLGVDIAPAAVRMARHGGANVLRRSVFDPLPREGGWDRVLLLDENVGIGGCPPCLLRRVAELMGPDGLALVETDPDDQADERGTVRIEDGRGRRSDSFPWATLGYRPLVHAAHSQGLVPCERWSAGRRRFVSLAHAA